MHLLTRYATACGAKIDKPFILTKFFPIIPKKYITFHPTSKYDSKMYDFWQDVIDIINPELSKENIAIIQIGTKNDRNYRHCYPSAGQTNICQAAYIISNSMLHFGSDSFAAHVASGFGKKIVALYSNNFSECVKPYWGNPEDHILIDSPKESKPNFSQAENPKTINEIKPEVIAKSILGLLGIPFTYPYTTFRVGLYTKNLFIEVVPNQVINEKDFGASSIVVRMDYLFDEEVLQEQLRRSDCSIVTTKPIDIKLLRSFKSKIKELIYDLQEDYNVDFIQEIIKLGIPSILATGLEGDSLNRLKMDTLNIGQIHRKKIPTEEEIRKFPPGLFYKTAKFTLSEGKIYPSKAAWKSNIPCDSFQDNTHPIIPIPEFWEELENVTLLTKN